MPQLQLPLEQLLLPPTPTGEREFCVRAKSFRPEGYTPKQVPLVLGTMVIEPFVTVFDMTQDRHRVGMAPKSAPLSAAEIEQQHGECAVVVSCTGQQRYVAASNSCEDPDCGSRYVQELDPESRVCVPTEGFRVATLIVLGLLAFGELLFQELHQRLPNRIQRTAARGRNAHGLPATSEE